MKIGRFLPLCLVLALTACQSPAPPIGDKLPGGTWSQVSQVFDARVKARFPVGSGEADMLGELSRQGFQFGSSLSHDPGYALVALRDVGGFPCRRFWRIEWNAEAGKITAIGGRFSGTCA